MSTEFWTDQFGNVMVGGSAMTGKVVHTPDQTPQTAGYKADQGKARFELIPPEALFAYAEILTFGAAKYREHNWEHGMKWSRVFGAMMRHMWAWWGGKGPTTKSFLLGELDEETFFSHLWHAMFCVGALIAYEERQIGEDDRWKGADDA